MPRFSDVGPLARYFARYPGFSADPNRSATGEFYRMCRVVRLKPGARECALKAFKDALTHEFNTIYGTDAKKLSSWQALCARMGTTPIPTTLEECRRSAMSTHVNLVDLTTTSGTVRTFQSVKELSKYTIKSRKVFPRENVHAGDLLRHLLRHIFNPELDLERGKLEIGIGRGRGSRT